MKSLLSGLALAATVLVPGTAVAATLLGDSVSQSFVPGFADQSVNPASAVVGAGVEFELTFSGGRSIFVDLSANSISLSYNGVANASLASSPSVLTLSDLDFGAGIGGIWVSEIDTGQGSFGGNLVSFGLDSIEIILSGVWSDSDQLTIDLYEIDAQVPLPASMPLLGVALGGVWALRRRKKA